MGHGARKYGGSDVVARALEILAATDIMDHAEVASLAVAGLVASGLHDHCRPHFPSADALARLAVRANNDLATKMAKEHLAAQAGRAHERGKGEPS